MARVLGVRQPVYRVRQFLRGLRPHLHPHEVARARLWLTPAEFALFRAAHPRDRRHSMDLFLLLQREAASRPQPPADDVFVAALLHDVGKGHPMVLDRVLFVVLDEACPGLARRIESERGLPWQRALWRIRHHAEIGATVLERAGSSPRVVELVRGHTGPGAAARAVDPELAWFIDGDGRV